MEQWQVQSNIEAFGYYEAARICKRKKLTLEQCLFLMFGKRV